MLVLQLKIQKDDIGNDDDDFDNDDDDDDDGYLQ